jgi:uncharacterized membrane protein
MRDVPGFGFLKILLSIGMAMNMSLLIGLAQKDVAKTAAHNIARDIRTVHEASATIAKYEPMIEEANKKLLEAASGS